MDSESFFCALGYLSIQENFGSHVTIIMSTCPTASQGNQCEMVHFLASVVACHPILHILVVVNWQLSKQGIHWPVSRDHTVGSVDPSRLLVHVFLSLPLTSFLFSTDRKLNSNYWISRSYLQRRKMEKRGPKKLLTTWQCLNYKKSSQQLPSCVFATRDSLFCKMFSLLFFFEQEKTVKNFSKKLYTSKIKKKLRWKVGFGT